MANGADEQQAAFKQQTNVFVVVWSNLYDHIFESQQFIASAFSLLTRPYYCFITGTGMTTTLIRVFAALEAASGLVTISTNAVKKGLNMAVETGASVVDCLQQAGMEEMEQNPKEHNYYKKFK